MNKNSTLCSRVPGLFMGMLLALLALMVAVPVMAQERSVTGKVIDENKEPIPGATVLIKGTNRGSATNVDGEFTVTMEGDENVIEVSFIGYDKKEVKVDNRSNLTISLASDEMALSEVVVTAFGMEREKKALGYATQAVEGSQLAEARQPNIADNLSGRIAGVQITPNSMPGSGSHILIRGSSSVAGNNQPLIVVDGVPIEQTDDRRYGGGLSEINPDNIKEINVLKGATAAAL